MKRHANIYLVVFVLMILFSTSIFADNQITYFNGGYHKINFRIYSSALSGMGSHSSNFGNTISSLIEDPSLVNLNPAGLAFIRKSSLVTDFAPDFSLNLGSFYKDLDKTINEQVDKAIEEMKDPDLVPIYPDVELIGGQIGGVGIATAIPRGKVGCWGIAFHKPLRLAFDIVGNGLSVEITDSTTNDEGELEMTKVPLSIELFSTLNLDINQVDIAYGKRLLNNLSFGIGISSLTCDINVDLIAKINGIIRQTTPQIDINKAFEDPTELYRNTLNDTIKIDFHKSLFGGKFALSYRPYKWLYLDGVYNIPRKENLEGSLRIVKHDLYALNINYDKDGPDGIPDTEDDEELFDPQNLKPSEITFTNRTIYKSNTLEFSYPGSFGLSAAAKTGKFTFVLSYEKPLGDLSFHYVTDIFKDGIKKDSLDNWIYYPEPDDTTASTRSYTVGLKMKHNAKIAIGYGRFALSGQLIVADQLSEGFKDENNEPIKPKENIIYGSASLGFGFLLTRNLALDVNLVALPYPLAVRSTLTYMF